MTARPDGAPFPRRLTMWLVGLAAACMIGSVVLAILTSEKATEGSGSDSLSASALGHRAFVDLLRETGVPVVVSRHATLERAASASLLLLIEPGADSPGASLTRLAQLVEKSRCPVLLVLPKWRGIESTSKQVQRAVHRPASQIEEILHVVDPAAYVRSQGPERMEWTTNEPRIDPELIQMQLVGGSGWVPLIGGDDGFLAAERHGAHRVLVLSDPDVVANHGLHHEANARLALDLVSRLRNGTGPVLVDETLHGFGVAESFWAQLFTFPLGLATAQAALAVILFLWAGMRRFGAPEPAPLPFEPGKRFLIEHTAGLLESERHHGEALARYARLTLEDAARRLHAESAGRSSDLRGWLARLESRKHVTEHFAELEAEAAGLSSKRSSDPRATLRLASRLRNWKQEIVDGSDSHTRVR